MCEAGEGVHKVIGMKGLSLDLPVPWLEENPVFVPRLSP